MAHKATYVTSRSFEFLKGDSTSPKLNVKDLEYVIDVMEGIESMVEDHILDVKPQTMKKLNSWYRVKPIMQRAAKNASIGSNGDYPFAVTGVQPEHYD